MIVPVIVPNRRPADMVKGIAGIARIWDNILVKVSVKLQIINMSWFYTWKKYGNSEVEYRKDKQEWWLGVQSD